MAKITITLEDVAAGVSMSIENDPEPLAGEALTPSQMMVVKMLQGIELTKPKAPNIP